MTLGLALIDIDYLDDAQRELAFVLKSAPENLAALRAMAEIHRRRDALPEAPEEYPTRSLARHDREPDPALRHPAEVGPTKPIRVPSVPAAGAGTPAQRTVEALEHFLTAIHVARADRRA